MQLADETIALAGPAPSSGLAAAHAARAQSLAALGLRRETAAALTSLSKVFRRLPQHATGDAPSVWEWPVVRP